MLTYSRTKKYKIKNIILHDSLVVVKFSKKQHRIERIFFFVRIMALANMSNLNPLLQYKCHACNIIPTDEYINRCVIAKDHILCILCTIKNALRCPVSVHFEKKENNRMRPSENIHFIFTYIYVLIPHPVRWCNRKWCSKPVSQPRCIEMLSIQIIWMRLGHYSDGQHYRAHV